jgi:hypothetical protein
LDEGAVLEAVGFDDRDDAVDVDLRAEGLVRVAGVELGFNVDVGGRGVVAGDEGEDFFECGDAGERVDWWYSD